MEQNLFNQNPDTPLDNPLAQSPTKVSPAKDKPLLKFKHFLTSPDPRIKALTILVVILIVLLISAALVSLVRSLRPRQSSTLAPTPTPEIVLTPTPEKTNIPEIYQQKFQNIEKEIQLKPELNPPVIDVEIGN